MLYIICERSFKEMASQICLKKREKTEIFWRQYKYSVGVCSKSLLTCSWVRCFSCDAARGKKKVKHSDWKLYGSNSQGRTDWNTSLSSYYPLIQKRNTKLSHFFCLWKLPKEAGRICIHSKTAGFHIPTASSATCFLECCNTHTASENPLLSCRISI